MALPFTLLLALLCVLPLGALADGSSGDLCYSPNGGGTRITGGDLQIPLHSCPKGKDGFANCCAEGDMCSPDRLCYNPGGGNIWRNFCTDPTWRSPMCSNLCRGNTEWDAGPVQMTVCPNGSMCCGSNNTACCSAKQGNYAFDPVLIGAGTNNNADSSKISAGAIAGIAVGGVAALLLLAVLILLFMRFRSDRNNKAAGFVGPKRSDTMEVREHVASPTAATPTATTMVPSIRSQPSTKSRHEMHQYSMGEQGGYYPADKERPLPAVPKPAYELQGNEGTAHRFEVSGRSVWGDEPNNNKN